MSVGAVNKQTGDRIPTAGMPAIDNALSATSINPVQNAIITAALADKQDKTDNSLQTTDKTVVGAVNELKSGLTNVADDVKLNTQDLTTPSRTKNLLPMTVDGIKALNTAGTWSGNTYTMEGITYTISLDDNGAINKITANGTATTDSALVLADNTSLSILSGKSIVLNGSFGGATETYLMQAVAYNGTNSVASRDGDSVIFIPTSAFREVRILIASGVSMSNVNFYPMLRYSTITDSTFSPYIPSVDARLEAVESVLTNVDVALSVPEGTGKNVLPYPFSDTTKTVNGVTFTDNGDGTISTSGTSTARTVFYIQNNNANLHIPAGIYTCSKSYQNTYTVLDVDAYNGNTWVKSLAKSSSTDDVTFTVDYDGYDRISIYLEIQTNIITDNIIFKPMIRPATITDPTFAPYIPSVDARLDVVESKQMVKTSETVTLNANGVSRLSLTLSQGRIVYAIKVGGGNDAYLVLPYCTTVYGGVWAVKVVDPTDMSPIASAEVTIAYGYLP